MDEHKKQVTAVLPARNCRKDLARCLAALSACDCPPQLIVVDDASGDGSARMVREKWPEAVLLEVPVHTGFAHAANLGLRLVQTPYALLIRPNLQPGRSCIRRLLEAMEDDLVFCAVPQILRPGDSRKKRGAVSAGSHRRKCLRDFDRGVSAVKHYDMSGRAGIAAETLAVPDGCALYRMEALEETGWLDERHFDGLEALDLSLRAAMYGWRTIRVPGAGVRGGSPSGSGDGTFRRQLLAGNSRYILYKHLPALQRLLGFPALKAADAAQALSFARQGEMQAYRMAQVRGKALCSLEKERREALADGVSVWAESLPDASFLGMEEGAERIYPLYLAGKESFSLSGLPEQIRLQLLLLRSLPDLCRLL